MLTEQRPLSEFTEKAYLDYSMYVILDRALPHLADGLKPVQRRIVYAMSELNLDALAKYKKSARTVGDVLGKFHPHGDLACYEAMVLMAQSFSYRYPLIDGQGNWGSTDDPKSFAAMRYTEARLTRYANLLLEELDQGTVEFGPNFDGTLEEPKLLPARVPNVLLNGSTGIAVGMATDIPPHNLREVAAACVHMIDHPHARLETICEHIQGPDFPTAAEIITPKEDLMTIYRVGTGSLKMRAVYQVEDEGEIVITALPHQVSGAKILEQISEEMQAKRLPWVADLRDESDHREPVRLVIVPRSNRVDVEGLMGHLFATTDLERSYRVNLNMIGLDGRPKVKGLAEILREWIEYRLATVRRRLQFRLDKVAARLHILVGFLIAYRNLDKIIRIIREEDAPKAALMKAFKLDEIQADAILDLKLRHLAKLEEQKIKKEQAALSQEQEELQTLLASPKKLNQLIKTELKEDAERFGDVRSSPLVSRQEAKAFSETDLIPQETVTIVLSQMGWVRCAKGTEIAAEELSYKAGDGFLMSAVGRSRDMTIFTDTTGRSYALAAHTLPSARGQGEPLTGRLSPPKGAAFVSVLMGETQQAVLWASSAGYGLVTTLEHLQVKQRGGKAVLKVPNGAKALAPYPLIEGKTWLALATTAGRLLIVQVDQVPNLPKGKGLQLIQLAKGAGDAVVAMVLLGDEDALTIHCGARKFTLKPKDWRAFVGERAKRGQTLPSGIKRVDQLTVS